MERSLLGDLREAAEVGKPGTNWKQVTPGNRKKVSPLVNHYMKQAHPFTACVRDNTKRFGLERAQRICAVVKDMGRRTTKWRGEVKEAALLLLSIDEALEPGASLALAERERTGDEQLDAIAEAAWTALGQLYLLGEVEMDGARFRPEDVTRVLEEFRNLDRGERMDPMPPAEPDPELANRPQRGIPGLAEATAGQQLARWSQRGNKARKGDVDYGAPGPKDKDFEKKHPRGTGEKGGEFIRKGGSGQEVKRVQRRLGVQVDGAFGVQTAAAVRSFQRRHGLKVDGIVGRQTLTALRGNVERARKTDPGRIDSGDRIFKKRERSRRGKSPRRAGGGVLVEGPPPVPFDEDSVVRNLLGRFAPKYGPAEAGSEIQAVIPEYDPQALKFGKFAGGSNGARWAKHKDGSRWLVKTYQGDENRVATELLSNAVYREMGARVPRAGMIRLNNGRKALAYETLPGEVRVGVFRRYGPSPEVGRHYMVDALLANWDVAGLDDDNILWGPDGEPFRVDQGGTLEFRAMGERKDFGPIPLEVLTMLRGQGGRAALVSLPEMKRQALEISEHLTPGKIDKLVERAPFHSAEMRERVRRNLKARVEWMRLFAEGRAPWPASAKPKLTEAEDSWLIPLEEVYIPHQWVENEHPRDQHGKFRNKVTGLKLGKGLNIGKVQVKRDKDGSYRVVRSGAITKFRNPGDAARAALDKSVKGTEPESIGGTQSFKDWNDYLATNGFPPGHETAFNGESGLGINQLKAYLTQLNTNRALAEASEDKYEKKGLTLIKARQKEVVTKILKMGGAPDLTKKVGDPDIEGAIQQATSSLTTEQAVKNVLEDFPPGSIVRFKDEDGQLGKDYVVKGAQHDGKKVILQWHGGDEGDILIAEPSKFIDAVAVSKAPAPSPEVAAVLKKYPPGTIVQWEGQPMEVHGPSTDGSKVRTKVPGSAFPASEYGGVVPAKFSASNFKVVKKVDSGVPRVLSKKGLKVGDKVDGGPETGEVIGVSQGSAMVQVKWDESEGGKKVTTIPDTMLKKLDAAPPMDPKEQAEYWGKPVGGLPVGAEYRTSASQPWIKILAEKGEMITIENTGSGKKQDYLRSSLNMKPYELKMPGDWDPDAYDAETGSVGGLSAAEKAKLPALSLEDIKKGLRSPTVTTKNMGDLPAGTVIQTPDGKIAVLKPAEPAYEGYVTAYDIATGEKFEPPKDKQPVKFSTKKSLVADAQKHLDKVMSPSKPGAQKPTTVKAPPAPDAGWGDLPTGPSAQSALVAHQLNVIDEMTIDERKALSYYTGSGYQEINSQLRKPGELGDASTEQRIAEIDAVFEKIDGLPEDMVLWRGVNGSAAAKYAGAQVGHVIRDNGFQSTSVSSSMADGWGELILKIKLPKGTKGLYVGPGMDISSHSSEQELILRRGIAFRVLAVRQWQGGSKKELVVEPMTGHV